MRSGVYVLGAVVVRWYDVITHRGLNAAGLWTTSKEWQNILKVRVGVSRLYTHTHRDGVMTNKICYSLHINIYIYMHIQGVLKNMLHL